MEIYYKRAYDRIYDMSRVMKNKKKTALVSVDPD